MGFFWIFSIYMNKFRFIVKSLKIILVSLLVIIFLSNFYVMIMTMINPGSYPDVFGFSTAVVTSGSMSPTIEVDELIIVKRAASYFEGDIVAFVGSSGKRTMHRIHQVTEEGFVTKGDANNAVDAYIVQHEDITGKVILHIPYVGKVTSFLRSPLGMFLIVLPAFLAFAIPEKSDGGKKINADGGASGNDIEE